MPELDLYPRLCKMIGLIDEHEITYALCGGLAMPILETLMLEVDMSAAAGLRLVSSECRSVGDFVSLAAAKILGEEAPQSEVKCTSDINSKPPKRETK